MGLKGGHTGARALGHGCASACFMRLAMLMLTCMQQNTGMIEGLWTFHVGGLLGGDFILKTALAIDVI